MGGLQLSDVVSESAVRFAIFGSIALPRGDKSASHARETGFTRGWTSS
jgi:hypothetical protein